MRKLRIVIAAAVNHGAENETQWFVAFDSNAARLACFMAARPNGFATRIP